MQPKYTPSALAALAALLGITPETPASFKEETRWCPISHRAIGTGVFTFIGPSPDSPGGDALWLAPLMALLGSKFSGINLNTAMGGYGACLQQLRYNRAASSPFTYSDALIRAGLVARVPEFVGIFGEGE